jgi:hypothetical protein
MRSEKQIIADADKAIASLGPPSQTNERYWLSIEAVAKLGNSNLSKPEIVEAIPELFSFVAKGMAAQQAVDAIIAKNNATRSEGGER